MRALLAVAVLALAGRSTLMALTIETSRPKDSTSIVQTKDVTTIVIISPRGIGSAVIKRGDSPWPDRIEILLKLPALEHFAAGNDTWLVESFLGNRGPASLWRLDRSGQRRMANKPLVELSPARTAHGIRVEIPNLLLARNCEEISLRWVDYHR